MKRKTSRWSPLAAAGALLVLSALGAEGAERPAWTAGIVTDTHVGTTRESCARVEMAMRLFAGRGVDLFVHCGDIADRHCPEGYRHLREIFEREFAARRPRELWVYAYHDWMDRRSEPFETVMADVRSLLKAPNDLYGSFDLQGWSIVSFPQYFDEKKLKSLLDAAVAAHPDRPVLLFGHEPPLGCADDAVTWGSSSLRRILAKYPQVVYVNGHAHSSLRSELNVWQGEFTSVNAGCLQTWTGHAVGASPNGKPSFGVLLLEAYRDRLVFRRFDVRSGREYAADRPWTIPLPFDPATAPYRRDRQAAAEPKPQFAPGARLALKTDAPFTTFTVRIPRAEAPGGCYRYQVEMLSGERGMSSRGDVFGQFYLEESDRRPFVTFAMNSGYFEPGRKYAVRVTPCNCFGGAGTPLETTFVSPEPRRGETLLEVAEPIGKLTFFADNELTRPVGPTDGWMAGSGGARFWMPVAIEGTGSYRVTFSAETDQPGPRTLALHMREAVSNRPLSSRIQTVEGRNGPVRYSIDFKRKVADGRLSLAFEGVSGRFRIANLRIERF